MTKITTIPAGYRLTVDSWENDGDNEQTRVIEGIQHDEDVMFYVALCKMHDMDTPYSNLYEPRDKEIQMHDIALLELIKKFPNMTYYDKPLTNVSDVRNIMDYIGIGATEYYLTGVCDSFKIEYIKKDIIFEDITEIFMYD